MARRMISDEELFNINVAAKEAICVLCNKKLTDLRRFSYHRHYKALHKDFARQHGLLDEEEEEDDAGPSRKIAKIEVRMDQKTYMSSMVELVTVYGLPLNIFKYPAFQKIVRPIEEGLKLTKHLDPDSIREVLSKVAEQMQLMIVNEIAGKMVCLKMDAATRMDREFLGINIQFVDRKTIKIRTLKIIELHDRHTAENLTEEVLKTLTPYGIDIRRLLTVTTDNARNMRATIDRLKLTQELELNGSGLFDDANIEEEEDDEEENDVENQEDECVDRKMELIEPILEGVRCAEHTLQLAVSDTLKETKMKEQLLEIRKIVKTLRKLPYKKLFTVSKRSKPKLDCATRWNSTYGMVQSLIKEKEFIMTLADGEEQIIDDSMWNFLERFIQAFKPVAEATVQLQNSQITFGDFFLIWEKCTFHVKSANDEISQVIAEKMDKRRVSLMSNRSFLAAIFVDQRINFRNSPFITDEERIVAMEFIKQTWDTIQAISGHCQIGNTAGSSSSGNGHPNSQPQDPFEAYLNSLDESNNSLEEIDIMNDLSDLSRMPRLKLPRVGDKEESILDWWYGFRSSKPELYNLVSAFLAMPCTQVSVERSFSVLALILTKHRTLLSEDNLRNILFIRLNQELLQKVDFNKT